MNVLSFSNNDKTIFLISLTPMLINALDYLLIGSYLPMLIALGVLIPVSYGFYIKSSFWSFRYWGGLLVGYGVVRSAIHLLVNSVGGGVESSIVYQLTIWFHLKNMALIGIGCLLVSKSIKTGMRKDF